ncbi:hypothetical protein TVAG_050880 [Trichomonas vaginalis G3]|uniref:Right handed beta helix domain-containing protein n=1 Tax=Trichomonas vaginalis (strain ATCC PRA-98 / G3) TaxID=412133 RepID=A2EEP7_TRIV3|nr:pectin lyase-like family [Trichomonas vaginalis G3]EAY08853.1 hypothetical protein TVAG_050880 [Trichomonas vaginalis G3]KAI5489348.1 pectin lyase-like family [Trichomonas vaginalis G3]|eukprot:XP_001321076.1 hypothetical protein [Trichomonas vaginalis G3]
MLEIALSLASTWEDYYDSINRISIELNETRQELWYPLNYQIYRCEYIGIENHALEFIYTMDSTHVYTESCTFINCSNLYTFGGSLYFGDSGSCVMIKNCFLNSKGYGGVAFYVRTSTDGFNHVDSIAVFDCGTKIDENNSTIYFGNSVTKFQHSNISNNRCYEFSGMYIKAMELPSEFLYTTFANNTQEKSILILYEGAPTLSFVYCSFLKNVQNAKSKDPLILAKSGKITFIQSYFYENVAAKLLECKECGPMDAVQGSTLNHELPITVLGVDKCYSLPKDS